MPRPDLDHLPTIIVAPPASGDAGVMINQAIMSVTFNGTRPGRVVFLPGTYTIVNRVWMVSNLVLQGQPDWSAQLVNLQTQGFGDGSLGFTGIAVDAHKGPDLYNVATAPSITNIALVDVYIDTRSITNFYTAISIGGVNGVWIEHCFFDNSMAPPFIFNGPWTIHAILLDDCDDVVITRCRTKYSQIKTCTTNSGRVEVSYCYCENPTNFGMSHVLQAGNGNIGDYRAIGNYIKDPFGQGGIYWGNDSTTTLNGNGRSCILENNIVDGSWMAAENGSGLIVRAVERVGSVDVLGNVVVNRTTGALPNNGRGISFNAQVQGTVIERARVFDNYCEYADREGIIVTGGIRDLVLRANHCVRTRAPQLSVTTGSFNQDSITLSTIDSITPVVYSGIVDFRGGN